MLKKHLKKIVSMVLVTMMAIGMSITAIAAEPYQNELEAVMDTSPADSGQVTHYDTTTGEMLVEDGELLTFDEVAIPVSEELKFILSVLELKKPVAANLLGILMLIAQPLLL